MAKNLVIYYSRTGENYFAGAVKSIDKGNTERVAEFIAAAVDADLFQVETVEPYSESYMECIEEAKAELNEGARPEVKALPETIDGYDTVFVGYPNWWGTMPMCMLTVLESFDWTGKRVAPFCTNEGSGMGTSERDLVKACRGATIERGLSITGNQAAGSQSKVVSWAKQFA